MTSILSKRILCIIVITCLSSCNNPNLPEETGTSTVAESMPATEVSASEDPPILFVQKCAFCHGNDGTAGIGNAANLQNSLLEKPAIISVINDGRSGMPAFKSKLSDAEITVLADFVHALSKPKK